MSSSRPDSLLARLGRLGPGIAIAATGVGAGDLAAAGASGVLYGTVLAWSILLGAAVKYVLNEGIARWQLGRGQSVLDAVVERFHPFLSAYLAFYLLAWTLIVGAALAAACGIATAALWPALSVAGWGAVHSAVAGVVVLAGGYRLFEGAMKWLIGLMFVTIVGAAFWLRPGGDVLRGLMVPSLPAGSTWMVMAVIGGVGGTVTLLAYGYWIDEKGWKGKESLGLVRLDLGVAYGLTAVFGVAVLVLAASVGAAEGGATSGVGLVIGIADRMGAVLGDAGRLTFLFGVWAAVFSSMLGVWQGVPSLLADFLRAASRRFRGRELLVPVPGRRDRLHTGLMIAVAITSALLVQLGRPEWMILVYAVLGSLFMPLLAFFLLRLNSRRGPLGPEMGYGILASAVLWSALALFLFLGLHEAWDKLSKAFGG